MLEDRMGGGDAQPIAALLRLRPVRVEDPHGLRLRIEGQQAVGAEAEVPVADPGQDFDHLLEWRGQVQDEVVVAQGLVFNEIDSH